MSYLHDGNFGLGGGCSSCGSGCGCRSCRSGLSGFGERYEREEEGVSGWGFAYAAAPRRSRGVSRRRPTAQSVRRLQQAVSRLQRRLNSALGMRLPVDGAMGPATRTAIRRFQHSRGLRTDGMVGPETAAELRKSDADAPPPAAEPAAMPPEGSQRNTPQAEPSSPDAAPPDAAQPEATPPDAGTSGFGEPPLPPNIVKVRGIRIAVELAPRLAALLAAAETDGVRMSGWGYRSKERQIELRRQHCGPTHYDIWQKRSSECRPPTATPGRSMHERGLAIDFTQNGRALNRQSPGFHWLLRNAVRFGLKNLPSEPWHWSVNGR